MIRKINLIIFSILFGSAVANADSTNIGLKVSYGSMDATGSHTTNSTTAGSLGSGGAAVSASGDASFPFGSVFIERQISAGSMDVALGLDINPTTQEVDKLGGGDGFDATVDMGNLYTAYIQPMLASNGNVTFFAKLGYSQADLDIKDITRQATTAGTASTDGNTSKSLEGPMYGIGVNVSLESSFVRLEATRIDFDEISHTNSNGKVLKADAELDAISISFGKSF